MAPAGPSAFPEDPQKSVLSAVAECWPVREDAPHALNVDGLHVL